MDIMMSAAPAVSSPVPQLDMGDVSETAFTGEDSNFHALLQQAGTMLSEEHGCCPDTEILNVDHEPSAGNSSPDMKTHDQPLTRDNVGGNEPEGRIVSAKNDTGVTGPDIDVIPSDDESAQLITLESDVAAMPVEDESTQFMTPEDGSTSEVDSIKQGEREEPRQEHAEGEAVNTKRQGARDLLSDTSGKETKAGGDAAAGATPDTDTPDECRSEMTARLGREVPSDRIADAPSGDKTFVRNSSMPDIPQASQAVDEKKTVNIESISLMNREPANMSLAKDLQRLSEFTEHMTNNPGQEAVKSDQGNSVQASMVNTLQDSRMVPEHPQSTNPPRMAGYQEILDAIVYVVRGNRRLGVSLEHENLGRLNISLNMSRGLVHVHIHASDSVVKEYIENNLHTMVDALQKEGVSIGGFSVALGEQNSRRWERSPFTERAKPFETGCPAERSPRNDGLINIFI